MVSLGVSPPPLEIPIHMAFPLIFSSHKVFPTVPVFFISQNSGGWKKLYQNPFTHWGGKTYGYVYGYEYF